MSFEQKIQQNLVSFKASLESETVPNIVRKHLTFGESVLLEHDKHFSLKAEIADHFKIHPSEVLIVGSAKIGFSIAPQKRYRFFHDQSDIDIAIVSTHLFNIVWEDVFNCWEDAGGWQNFDQFKQYFFRGWIRPDYLPTMRTFRFRREWWDYFQGLTRSSRYGPYKIHAGLYKSWHFLESYQKICVTGCKQALDLS